MIKIILIKKIRNPNSQIKLTYSSIYICCHCSQSLSSFSRSLSSSQPPMAIGLTLRSRLSQRPSLRFLPSRCMFSPLQSLPHRHSLSLNHSRSLFT